MKVLYVHTNDTGADCDAMNEPAILADNNAHEKARATMHAIAYAFLHNNVPPVGPSLPGPSPPPVPPGQAAASIRWVLLFGLPTRRVYTSLSIRPPTQLTTRLANPTANLTADPTTNPIANITRSAYPPPTQLPPL